MGQVTCCAQLHAQVHGFQLAASRIQYTNQHKIYLYHRIMTVILLEIYGFNIHYNSQYLLNFLYYLKNTKTTLYLICISNSILSSSTAFIITALEASVCSMFTPIQDIVYSYSCNFVFPKPSELSGEFKMGKNLKWQLYDLIYPRNLFSYFKLKLPFFFLLWLTPLKKKIPECNFRSETPKHIHITN